MTEQLSEEQLCVEPTVAVAQDEVSSALADASKYRDAVKVDSAVVTADESSAAEDATIEVNDVEQVEAAVAAQNDESPMETDEVPMPTQAPMMHAQVVLQDIMQTADTPLSVPSPTRQKMQKRTGRAQKNGQTYHCMVKEAVETVSKETRKGASLPAIKKYLMQTFNLNVQQSRTNKLINKCLKSGIESGCFVKVKGRGLSGSFKLGQDRKEKERAQRIAKEKRQKEKEKERRFVDRELTKLRHKDESERLRDVMKVRIARRKHHQRLLETGASPLQDNVLSRIQNVLEAPSA